jgi:hypothetical protein
MEPVLEHGCPSRFKEFRLRRNVVKTHGFESHSVHLNILFKLNTIIINKAKNNLKTNNIYNMGGKEWG